MRRAALVGFIFGTVSGDLPWDKYVAGVQPQGKLCLIGPPGKPFVIGALRLVLGEKAIVGGQAESVGDRAQMLGCMAGHGIKPIIETFSMAEADRAMVHTRSGKARSHALASGIGGVGC